MYFEKIVDIKTGEETIREFTQVEIDLIEKNKAAAVEKANQIAQAEAARMLLLQKLGLTEEEAAVLLG